MLNFPYHLQYELNRRQRLIPHLARWLPYSLSVFFVFAMVVGAFTISPWLLLLALLCAWFIRGFFFGLINVLFISKMKMDLLIEGNAIGYLTTNNEDDRMWLFLDGMLKVKAYCRDVLTIFHYNGSIINIVLSSLDEELLAYIKSIEMSDHPDQVQSTLARGKLMQELEETMKEYMEWREKTICLSSPEELPDGLQSKTIEPLFKGIMDDGRLEVECVTCAEGDETKEGSEILRPGHPQYGKWKAFTKKDDEYATSINALKEKLLESRNKIHFQQLGR